MMYKTGIRLDSYPLLLTAMFSRTKISVVHEGRPLLLKGNIDEVTVGNVTVDGITFLTADCEFYVSGNPQYPSIE